MILTQTAPQTKEALFTRLYLECFPAVARYISRSGGDLDEARDIFQEALLVFYEKVEIGKAEIRVSENAYILGIARNIYLKKRERTPQTETLDGIELGEENELAPGPEKLLHFLQEAGKKCMDMLSAFYYEKLSMKHLADRFGFRSERSATVQKYKCLEKVRESIHEQSLNYEDFLD